VTARARDQLDVVVESAAHDLVHAHTTHRTHGWTGVLVAVAGFVLGAATVAIAGGLR